MNGLNDLQILPYWIWVMAAATGIVIVLLAIIMNLFYRKRLQAMEPLNTDVGDLINQKQQLETDVDSIKDWIATQKDELLRLEAERKEQEIIRAELLRLEQEAAKRQDENKDQIEEVGNLENQRHLLVQSMEKLEKEKADIEKEIKALGKENEDSKNALKGIEKELKKFEKEEKKLTDAIENGNVKLDNVEILGCPRYDNIFYEGKNEGYVLLAASGPVQMHVRCSTVETYEKYESEIKEICKIVLKLGKKLIIKI